MAFDERTLTLNSGHPMPQLGFGVFQVPPDDAEQVVTEALATGYRSIDTAQMYRNEDGVGAAIAKSGIPRDDLFVTTKLNNDSHKRNDAAEAFDRSLDALGLDHVDLFLIHWPLPQTDVYVDVWRSLEKIASSGRSRSVGVSNFQIAHLQRLFDETDVVPALNQIELHPFLTQEPLREFHIAHNIATEAWSPLGGQGGSVLDDQTVTAIAEKYGVSAAQIVIRWHLQIGNVVIPKSGTPERIRSNFDVFSFELDDDDVQTISGLSRNARTGPDPDTFTGG